MKKSVLLGCLWAAAALATSPTIAADSEEKGDAVRGKQLFQENNCRLCHGTQGQGGGIFGPRIGPNVFPWLVVKIYVRNPAGDMPPFSEKVISDKDLLDIWTYINTVPAPPPVQSIAILKD